MICKYVMNEPCALKAVLKLSHRQQKFDTAIDIAIDSSL
jgi:hypothetical protein